jgi:hypothetical protein
MQKGVGLQTKPSMQSREVCARHTRVHVQKVHATVRGSHAVCQLLRCHTVLKQSASMGSAPSISKHKGHGSGYAASTRTWHAHASRTIVGSARA